MRLALLLQLVLLCGLSIAACTSGEEERERQDRSREFEVRLNVQTVNEQIPAKVQCPDDVDADKGRHLRCAAKASDGPSVAVDVVQTGVESVKLLTKLLETRKVEALLRHRLNKLLRLRTRKVEGLLPHGLNVGRPPDVVVGLLDCQDLVEVKKGGRFTCRGTTVLSNFTVRATFTNDLGMFSYTVRPS